MSVYLVTGERGYREHPQGAKFEAVLDPDSEARAIRAGAIKLIHRSTPGLRPGSWTLPRGWATRRKET